MVLRQVIGVLLLVSTFEQSFGQDTHYWTYRYGTRAVLMGGPAVGGLEDNSSVIYNPALLSFVKSTSISLNSNVYQFMNITAKDGAGTGQDVNSNQFSTVPITVSGLLRKKRIHSRWTLGYAIIVPTEFTFKTTAREAGLKQIVDGAESPGSEEYVGQFSINTRLSETLGAVAVAYRINNNWSVGLANQLIYRSHTYTANALTRMILNNAATTLVSTSESQSIEYTNLRYSPKVGFSYAAGRWSAGLAIVLPSINVVGSGTIARDIMANNLQFNVESNSNLPPNYKRLSINANDRKTQLPTVYKSPLSISAGVAYKGRKILTAVSLEWFNNVPLYDIMLPTGDVFKRPTNLNIDSKKFLQLNASNKSVTNFAIGMEYTVSEKLSFSTGFRTNNSFYDQIFDERIADRNKRNLNNNALNLDISSWNIYHLVIGGTFRQERRDLSIGFNFSWGERGIIKQFTNFDSPTESTFLLGQRVNTEANFLAYGIVLGYTFRMRSTEN